MPTFFSPLADHLWQSTVVVVAAGLLSLTLRKNQARTRHWIWLAASLKFLIPFALLISLGNRFDWLASPAVPTESSISTFVVQQAARPFTWNQVTALPIDIAPNSSGASFRGLPALAIAVWICGCLTLFVRWLRNWRRVHDVLHRGYRLTDGPEIETLRRLERSIGRSKPIPLVSSASAIEPSVFGTIQPVLLWPAGLTARLADAELEAILLHELSHVRRRDNLTAMLHMMIESMFWFHPLVWWLGTRLVDEREKACDEDVLRWGGASQVYAEGILKVCEFCMESPLTCAAGVSGSDLKRRIEDIMKNQVMAKLSFSRVALLSCAAIFALAGN
jgi:beta-lactamase regulating signal transducer with metallopeptidase domain